MWVFTETSACANASLFTDSAEKYDSRDVQKLQTDDALVEGYLTWRLYVVDDALKMIDESLQWRKEYGLNGKRSFWMICNVIHATSHHLILGWSVHFNTSVDAISQF